MENTKILNNLKKKKKLFNTRCWILSMKMKSRTTGIRATRKIKGVIKKRRRNYSHV
jgi:hypothetical protein